MVCGILRGIILTLEVYAMALTLTAQSNEPLGTGEYLVELTAIELVDGQYGKQLKWTFLVPDHKRTLVAYSSFSASLNSKCMKWASALLNRAIEPNEQVDFEKLVGRTAIAVVVRKQKDDGSEYNRIDNLLPIRKSRAEQRTLDENDPFA
jgi:hypothetical protein